MNIFSQLDISLLSGYQENLSQDVLQQMLELYQQQSINYLESIHQSLTLSQDDWQKSCHKMKGAAGSIGFTKVRERLVEMEFSTLPTQEKQQQIIELTQLNELAINEFISWLSAK